MAPPALLSARSGPAGAISDIKDLEGTPGGVPGGKLQLLPATLPRRAADLPTAAKPPLEEVTEAGGFGGQIELVVAVRGEAVADALVDGDAEAAERGDLLGIIGQPAHPAEAEVVEHLGEIG